MPRKEGNENGGNKDRNVGVESKLDSSSPSTAVGVHADMGTGSISTEPVEHKMELNEPGVYHEENSEKSLWGALVERDVRGFTRIALRSLTLRLAWPIQIISSIDSKVAHMEERINRFLNLSQTMYLDKISSFLLFSVYQPSLRTLEKGRLISAPYLESAGEVGRSNVAKAFELSLYVLGHNDPPKVTALLSAHTVKFSLWLSNSDNYPILLFVFFCHFVLVYILFFRDGIFPHKKKRRSLNVAVSKFKQSRYITEAGASTEALAAVGGRRITIELPDYVEDDLVEGDDAWESPRFGRDIDAMDSSKAKVPGPKGKKKDKKKKPKTEDTSMYFHGWDTALDDDERRAATKFEDPDLLVGWRVRIRPDWTDRKVTGIVVDHYKKILRRKTVFRVLMDKPPSENRRLSMSESIGQSLEVAVTCGISGNHSQEHNGTDSVDNHNIKNFDLRRLGRGHGVPFTEVAWVGKVSKKATSGDKDGIRTTSYTIDDDAHAVI